jgi:hypothetical protein
LDGDRLRLCLSIGGERPRGFATRAGDGQELFTLRRGAPADVLNGKLRTKE